MTKTTPCGSRSMRRSKLVAVLDDDRRQRIGGDRGHIVGALVEAAIFAAVVDRPAHLPGEFRHDDVGHLVQPRDTLQHQLDALFERPLRPGLLRLAGAGDGVLGRLQRQAPGVRRKPIRPPVKCIGSWS